MRIVGIGFALGLALTSGSSVGQDVLGPAVAPAVGSSTAAPPVGPPAAAPPAVSPTPAGPQQYRFSVENIFGDIQGSASTLVIFSAERGEIKIPLAGPNFVPGAFEAAQGIVKLDVQIASRQSQLTPEARTAIFEFRELAAGQLVEGLTEARSSYYGGTFPQGEAYKIGYLTRAAAALSYRTGPNRVTTYIKGPDDSWNLDFVTWEEHRQKRREWRPYAYGNPLDIKTYVFRLRGTRLGSTAECEHSVPVWDDPTRYQLTC